jgi:hypothetical protein
MPKIMTTVIRGAVAQRNRKKWRETENIREKLKGMGINRSEMPLNV